MKKFLVLSVVALSVLAGCAAQQQQLPQSSPPPKIEDPGPGEALVYVFRPALDATRRSDRPTLLVDDQTIGILAYKSYTKIGLQAGRHRIRVVPSPDDSKDWATEVGMEVAEGKVIFVAVWNPDQPQSARRDPTYGPAPSTIWSTCKGSFACGAAAGAILYLINAPHGESTPAPAGANLEVVDASIGTHALGGLSYVEPHADHLPSSESAAH